MRPLVLYMVFMFAGGAVMPDGPIWQRVLSACLIVAAGAAWHSFHWPRR